jgi:hypothetical protein
MVLIDVPRNQNLKWLEIGCGANALLSRIVLQLHQDSQVTAFEVNKNSAEHAKSVFFFCFIFFLSYQLYI